MLAILFDDPDACALPDLFFLFSLITISLASWSWICCNEFGAGCRFHDLSCRTGFGAPLLDMINGSGSGSCNRVDFLNLRFYHFHFHMCFAPQHRAFSEHLDFQKCSDTKVFSTCVLPNVLRATTACTFSPSPLPKLFRNFLTSKSASRQNGVTTACNFFISHLARWLRTCGFGEPTFRPSGATKHWENTVSRDFSTFSRAWIFFLLTFSELVSSAFFTLTLATCPYCRNFEF